MYAPGSLFYEQDRIVPRPRMIDINALVAVNLQAIIAINAAMWMT